MSSSRSLWATRNFFMISLFDSAIVYCFMRRYQIYLGFFIMVFRIRQSNNMEANQLFYLIKDYRLIFNGTTPLLEPYRPELWYVPRPKMLPFPKRSVPKHRDCGFPLLLSRHSTLANILKFDLRYRLLQDG